MSRTYKKYTMKLGIAAGILPIALSSKPGPSLPLKETLLSKDHFHPVNRKLDKLFRSHEGLLRPSRILKNPRIDRRPKCNPSSVDPDVGILSCGSDQYCMESKLSELGGVCVAKDLPATTSRELFANGYYFDMAEYYCGSSGSWEDYLDCDCSNFDKATKTGTAKCELLNTYCFQDTSCETCVKLSASFRIASRNDYSIDWCYNFFLPYEQNICVEYTHNPQASATCRINLNDMQCTSCSVSYYDYTDPKTAEVHRSTCAAFDCTNTDGNHDHRGDMCDDLDINVAPILDQTCIDSLPVNLQSGSSIAYSLDSSSGVIWTCLTLALLSKLVFS